eukprot:Sspe_Gene.66213::Locus_39133_Transcript_1_1_Confidence_1.000_Length_3731::g.66213::m.66213
MALQTAGTKKSVYSSVCTARDEIIEVLDSQALDGTRLGVQGTLLQVIRKDVGEILNHLISQIPPEKEVEDFLFLPSDDVLALRHYTSDLKDTMSEYREKLVQGEEAYRSLFQKLNKRDEVIQKLRGTLYREVCLLQEKLKGMRKADEPTAINLFDTLSMMEVEAEELHQQFQAVVQKNERAHQRIRSKIEERYQHLLEVKDKELLSKQLEYRNAMNQIERDHQVRLEELQRENQAMKDAAEELRRTLENEMEAESARRVQQKVEEAVRDLQAEISRLHDEVVAQSKRITQLMGERAAMEADNANLALEKHRIGEQNTRLVRQVQVEYDCFIDDIRAQRREEASAFEAILSAKDRELAGLRTQIHGLQEQCEAQRSVAKQSYADGFEASRRKWEGQALHFAQAAMELEAELHQMIECHARDHTEWTAAREEHSAELGKRENMHQKMKKECVSLRDTIASLEDETLASRKAAKGTRELQLERAVVQLRKDLDELRAEAESTNSHQRIEIDSLQTQLEDARIRNEMLSQSLDEAKNLSDTLAKQLELSRRGESEIPVSEEPFDFPHSVQEDLSLRQTQVESELQTERRTSRAMETLLELERKNVEALEAKVGLLESKLAKALGTRSESPTTPTMKKKGGRRHTKRTPKNLGLPPRSSTMFSIESGDARDGLAEREDTDLTNTLLTPVLESVDPPSRRPRQQPSRSPTPDSWVPTSRPPSAPPLDSPAFSEQEELSTCKACGRVQRRSSDLERRASELERKAGELERRSSELDRRANELDRKSTEPVLIMGDITREKSWGGKNLNFHLDEARADSDEEEELRCVQTVNSQLRAKISRVRDRKPAPQRFVCGDVVDFLTPDGETWKRGVVEEIGELMVHVRADDGGTVLVSHSFVRLPPPNGHVERDGPATTFLELLRHNRAMRKELQRLLVEISERVGQDGPEEPAMDDLEDLEGELDEVELEMSDIHAESEGHASLFMGREREHDVRDKNVWERVFVRAERLYDKVARQRERYALTRAKEFAAANSLWMRQSPASDSDYLPSRCTSGTPVVRTESQLERVAREWNRAMMNAILTTRDKNQGCQAGVAVGGGFRHPGPPHTARPMTAMDRVHISATPPPPRPSTAEPRRSRRRVPPGSPAASVPDTEEGHKRHPASRPASAGSTVASRTIDGATMSEAASTPAPPPSVTPTGHFGRKSRSRAPSAPCYPVVPPAAPPCGATIDM